MFLTRVELTNVRCIRSLTLPLEMSSGVTRKWTLLLGDNGVGKSTLMRSIGLVLAGSSALAELIRRSRQLGARSESSECTHQRRPRNRRRREAACQPENLSRRHDQGSLRERTKRRWSCSTAQSPSSARNYLVIAYGASRRLSSTKLSTQTAASRFRHPRANNVATLFSPDAMFNPLETWAIDLHYRRQEEGLAIIHEAMRKLLPGMTFKGIDRERRDLMFDTVDGVVPLRI